MGSGSASRRRSWRARSPWWRRFRFSTCWRGNSVAVRFPTLLPGLGLATVMIGVDQFLGSAAYGIFAIVPGVIAMAGQSVELVRAPHVKGVSTASLLLGTLNQTLWAIWAVQLQDSGSMIAILATSCSWCSTSSGTSFGDSACARSSHRHSRCCPRWPQPVAAHRQPKRSSRQPTTERGPSSKGRAPL